MIEPARTDLGYLRGWFWAKYGDANRREAFAAANRYVSSISTTRAPEHALDIPTAAEPGKGAPGEAAP